MFVNNKYFNHTRKCKELEAQAIKVAESGNLDEALALFDQAVSSAPDRAASYNNRAQVNVLDAV
jgi:hypothetical protein